MGGSTFSEATRTSRAGFVLAEVLVALLVAGLLLTSLARSFAEARRAARIPADIASATAMAGAAIHGVLREGDQAGYSVVRRSDAVEVVKLESTLAPAPGRGADRQGTAATTPAAQNGAPSARLRHISIDVRMPSGRTVTFETVRLETPQS